MIIPIFELEKLVKSVLTTKYREKEVQKIKDVIMFGELSGRKSHGIVRLLTGKFAIMNEKAEKKPELIERTKLSAIINANNNPGMLAASMAMDWAIKTGKQNGFAIIGANGCNSSSGCLTYYLNKIASQNLIAIIMCQSPPHIAPYGGTEPLFGTNPVAFGIPSVPDPLIFDMATASITFGDILKAISTNTQLPANTTLDIEGNPTTDPEKAKKGVILPFGNHYKSSGLAMMVEIFAGLWTGAQYSVHDASKGWGNIFIVFSPELLMDLGQFKTRMQNLVKTVRNSKAKTIGKVRIPGEQTMVTYIKNLKNGKIDVDEKMFMELKQYNEN